MCVFNKITLDFKNKPKQFIRPSPNSRSRKTREVTKPKNIIVDYSGI